MEMQEIIKGGWIMLPLLICSIAAVGTMMERFCYFRRIRLMGEPEAFLECVNKGKLEEALEKTVGSNLPVMRVLRSGVEEPSVITKSMESAAILEVSKLKRGMPILDTIITVSPLLGLLGTIVGMMSSFNIMAMSGIAQPNAVTGGVGEALISTASGIVVAVAALLPYNYFSVRIEQEIEHIEYYASKLEGLYLKMTKGEAA